MHPLDGETFCPECTGRFIDAGDELVCPGCGIAKEKEVVEPLRGRTLRPRDAVRAPLGSYMGPRSGADGTPLRGIAGRGARYGYLKAVSDFAGRDEDASVDCARLIERVGEKLSLPNAVLLEAASTAKRVLNTVKTPRRLTVSAVSAYSLISACRIAGTVAVSPREIIEAHRATGRRVTPSLVIHLSLESPVRTYASGPKEYVPRILARLSSSAGLSRRLGKDGLSMAGYLGALRECGMELLSSVDRTEMTGKRPCALAAAALYSAEAVLALCEGRGKRVTQRELAECGDTSEYTVREQVSSIFSPVVQRAAARRLPNLPLATAR